MKLIVISNPININNEHGILCSLFEAGLHYFHLRKPDFSLDEMERYLKKIPGEYLNRIVIHSHYELADKHALKGKHKTSYVRDTSNKNYISTSFHSLKELEENKVQYEYAFLSPIYDSISKESYKSTFDKMELKSFLSTYNKSIEIIALGGIKEENIAETMDLGFNGIAVLGAVWNTENPIEKFNAINNKVMLNLSQHL